MTAADPPVRLRRPRPMAIGASVSPKQGWCGDFTRVAPGSSPRSRPRGVLTGVSARLASADAVVFSPAEAGSSPTFASSGGLPGAGLPARGAPRGESATRQGPRPHLPDLSPRFVRRRAGSYTHVVADRPDVALPQGRARSRWGGCAARDPEGSVCLTTASCPRPAPTEVVMGWLGGVIARSPPRRPKAGALAALR